jgi:GGDEF domain-containing protein
VLDRVLARIDAELERPFPAGAKHVHLTVSVGVAVFPSDGQDAHALLHHADASMYRAKARASRGRAQKPARTSNVETSAKPAPAVP